MTINKLVFCLLLPLALFADIDSKKQILEEGKAIYEQTCISCHGDNGETNPEIKLVVTPRKLNKTILSKKESFLIIKESAHYLGAHSDIMPAFKYVYTDREIDAVTTYISETFNPNRDKRIKKLLRNSKHINTTNQTKMLKTGEEIFKRSCTKCHSISGNSQSEYVKKSKKSKVFIYPYNLTKTLLEKDEIFLYTKYGGQYWGAAKNDMPSWQHKYNDFELKSVAKYIMKERNKNNP